MKKPKKMKVGGKVQKSGKGAEKAGTFKKGGKVKAKKGC